MKVVQIRLPDDLADELQAYRDSLEVRPSFAATVLVALRTFLDLPRDQASTRVIPDAPDPKTA